MPASTTDTARYCSFRLAADCFAFESTAVSEVIRSGAVTRVPLAPDGIVGIVQLRGRIVPIIDPARILGIEASGARQVGTLLVIRIQDDLYGLLVDEMLDVVEIPTAAIEHPTSNHLAGESLVGVFAQDDRLVHLLDPQRIMHFLVRQRPPSLSRHGAHNDG